MKTATFIDDVSHMFTGEARLYHVRPALGGHDYVVSSALGSAFDSGQPETYIFGANPKGEVLSWSELEGSQRGICDPDSAIRNAGYEIA